MNNFFRNKKIIFISILIFLCMLYVVVNKSINKSDKNIITEESITENKNDEEKNYQYSEDEIDVVTEDTEDDGNEAESEIENKEEEQNDTKEEILVYVTGEVNSPGVVMLKKGSRIADAINAAGGTTSKANTTKVNLVYVLEDGMKVNIPSKDELKNDSNFEYITKNSGDGANDFDNSNDSVSGSQTENVGSSTKKEHKFSSVNINTATQTELETLPGIGPSIALKIINYRKENGKFSSIDDLKNVSGIGEAKFEKIKKYITV